jgi:hypothetical protein
MIWEEDLGVLIGITGRGVLSGYVVCAQERRHFARASFMLGEQGQLLSRNELERARDSVLAERAH